MRNSDGRHERGDRAAGWNSEAGRHTGAVSARDCHWRRVGDNGRWHRGRGWRWRGGGDGRAGGVGSWDNSTAGGGGSHGAAGQSTDGKSAVQSCRVACWRRWGAAGWRRVSRGRWTARDGTSGAAGRRRVSGRRRRRDGGGDGNRGSDDCGAASRAVSHRGSAAGDRDLLGAVVGDGRQDNRGVGWRR